MKRVVLALLLTIPAIAQGWTKEDTIRESAVVAITVADWGQTLSIADHPDTLREYNPILGDHPSRGQVNLYFAGGIALHYLIARMLPPSWRHGFQYVTLGWEGAIVSHNFHVGIQVRF